MFFIYKVLLRDLGTVKLGVWAIVMGATAIARLSDLGFAGGMVKFVAKYNAIEDFTKISELIRTAALSVMVVLVVLSTSLYFAAGPLLSIAIKEKQLLALALLLMPYAIGSLFINGIAGVYLSALDGYQRIDIKNIILLVGTIVYLIAIIALVKGYGFVGLGYAALLQSIFVLSGAVICLARIVGVVQIIPVSWRYSHFKEMLSYNVYLQIGAMTSLFLDPLVKLLIGHFGGVGHVAYYDMSNQLVTGVRSLIVSVNQVIVPVIANMKEKAEGQISKMYQRVFQNLYFVAIGIFTILAMIVPLISRIWIGHVQPDFMAVAYCVILAMFVNTMAGPAYFTNMGTGHVKLNAQVQVGMALASLSLGLMLGHFLGWFGPVIGTQLSAIVFSALLIVGFLRHHQIAFIWTWADLRLLFGSLTLIAVSIVFLRAYFILLLPAVGIFSILYTNHPVMRSLWREVVQRSGRND